VTPVVLDAAWPTDLPLAWRRWGCGGTGCVAPSSDARATAHERAVREPADAGIRVLAFAGHEVLVIGRPARRASGRSAEGHGRVTLTSVAVAKPGMATSTVLVPAASGGYSPYISSPSGPMSSGRREHTQEMGFWLSCGM